MDPYSVQDVSDLTHTVTGAGIGRDARLIDRLADSYYGLSQRTVSVRGTASCLWIGSTSK